MRHERKAAVGSYRRKAESSGDIDVLIKIPEKYSKKEQKELFETIVESMVEDEYMIDVLSQGEKKVLGYAKIKKGAKVRRIDLLATPEKEYPYAVLYFTGSDKFNIEARKEAIKKGLSLNEHGFTALNDQVKPPKKIKTEEDIFKVLGMTYLPPNKR